jgi:hypothetical protein
VRSRGLVRRIASRGRDSGLERRPWREIRTTRVDLLAGSGQVSRARGHVQSIRQPRERGLGGVLRECPERQLRTLCIGSKRAHGRRDGDSVPPRNGAGAGRAT